MKAEMEPFAERKPTLEIVWEAVESRNGRPRRLVPTYAALPEPEPARIPPAAPGHVDSEVCSGHCTEKPGLIPEFQTIRRGDGIRFSVRSPISGSLSFFDFGTDGSVRQLLPSASLPDPKVEAGEWLHLPGSFGTGGPWWRVADDTAPTAETGNREGFLFVVTKSKEDWAWGGAEAEILP